MTKINTDKEYWHPLLKKENQGVDNYPQSQNSVRFLEVLIGLVTGVLLIVAIFCIRIFFRIDDDLNPMAGIGLLFTICIYIIGFLTSGFLLWFCFEEQLRLKVLSIINFGLYVIAAVVLLL
ncbi:MAG: hypothetical protein N4A71_01685 [Carboxylicivirga sp.]|jgi:hypothetical protein|nr:hypothetical protein [Carboxylicivirga sp.]